MIETFVLMFCGLPDTNSPLSNKLGDKADGFAWVFLKIFEMSFSLFTCCICSGNPYSTKVTKVYMMGRGTTFSSRKFAL